MIRLGIDFGTANTVVSYWDPILNISQVLRIPEFDQQRTGSKEEHQFVIPSTSAYPKSKEGPVLYGSQVTDEVVAAGEFHVFRYTKSVAMDLVADIQVPVYGGSVRPKEAAASFLRAVVNNAQLIAGDPDLEVVMTAPIESFDKYRNWLYDQVVDPSISNVRIVDEATAAAAGYSYKLSAEERILIFDFGAGTLDVTIAIVDHDAAGTDQSGVRVLAKRGCNLGGKHIDAMILKWALGEIGITSANQVLINQVTPDLLAACEKAKVELSSSLVADISIRIPGEETVRTFELTRDEFEKILRSNEVLRKTNQTLMDVLLEANNRGVSQNQIGAVFLVGGTSLIPGVAEIIRNIFSDEIIHLDCPLEAVAKGAASIAGGFQASDHIQHDYAIRHIDPDTGMFQYREVVPAGTTFPTTKPIFSQMVQASYDGQVQLGLQIYEVASRASTDLSSSLELQMDESGRFRLLEVSTQRQEERRLIHLNEKSPTFLEADPPGNAMQNRFRIDFEIDMLRRLTVTAYDLLNNRFILTREPVVRLS